MDDFRLLGDVFLKGQLLVSLATKEHRDICFPVEFHGKLEVVKKNKKRKTNVFLEKENSHLHDFFHSVLDSRTKGYVAKTVYEANKWCINIPRQDH